MLKRKQRFQSLAVILFCSITLSGFTGCGREATFSDEAIRIGIVADIHCEPDQWDKKGTCAIPYMKNFIDEMNKRFLPHAVIELGDKLNNVDGETDARNMEAVKAVFDTIEAPLYYTFGNHEVYTLRKRDVSSILGTEETFTSFDIGGLHFVILDSQYNPANGSDRYTQKGTPKWMGSGYITVPSLVDGSDGGYAKAIIDPESNIMDIDVVGRMPAHYRLDI
ncbi:MAG: metallophosphoesterase [Candidatus Tritonobacter lacicola]|nr:metallophosphoesterase [Candidatus Tritonobacter lacicola]